MQAIHPSAAVAVLWEACLAQRGKHLAEDVVRSIYGRFGGTTWYVQKMLNQLFASTPSDGTATLADVDGAEMQILTKNEEAY